MKINFFPFDSCKTLQVSLLKYYTNWHGKQTIQIVSFAFMFFLLASPFSLFAQTRTITGFVHDEKGTPLDGVSVFVMGTSTGTTTNRVGKFSISAAGNGTLSFSFVGYADKEIPIAGRSFVDVQLSIAAESLSKVIIVSYGTGTRRNITGAVTAIDDSAVKDIPAAEFGQQLQGKVAGVQITQNTGTPGQGIQFRIRGAASFSSGFQPLVVVDGQPLTGVDASRNGDINLIDPNEIESFTVLKDAAATALYGSRASNGVIIITTKHAKAGRTNVSLTAYNGWQTVPQKGRPHLMNANQFATFMNGLYQDKATYEGYTGGIPDDYADPSKYGAGTNWYDAILRTAPIQSYSLNLSSGTDKLSSSTSLNYFDQQGVLLNVGMKRYAFRSNNEYRPNDRLKFGLNLAPSYQLDHNTRRYVDGNRQIIGLAKLASPLVPIYDSAGKFNTRASSFGMLGISNPVQQLELLNSNTKTFRLLSNLYGELEIIKNLSFRSSFNVDLGAQEYNQFFGSMFALGFNPPVLPHTPVSNSSASASYNYLSWLNENTLTYKLQIKDHTFDFLAGYSSQKYERDYRSENGSNFAGDAIPWISGAAVTSGNNNNEAWSLASAFGRINYNFKNRYFVSGTIRSDGSSRFGANNKYGTFPSISGAWVVSDEKFFPQNDVVNFLKLRGSYGKTGNFNVGNYQQVSNITSTNYVFGGTLTPGVSITSLGNKNLTWEISKQSDFGLDMNLLNNRLTFSYDYYSNFTEGMLFATLLPVSSGYASITSNVGKFHMWGHEFQLNSQNLKGKLTWSTGFNISFNSNKVIALPPNTPFIGGGPRYSGFNRTIVGGPIGQFYGYVFEGIYATQADLDKFPKEATSALGSARMKDVNGDNKIDANDRTLIGNPNPKFIYGMTNTLSYKNFDFNVIVAGQYGNKVLNFNMQDEHNNDGVFNMTTDMIDRWRSPADIGDGKTPGTRSGTTELYRVANTTWISDGSFLTVKNITLGYTFSPKTLKYLKSARIYASVQQAFVFTNYTGQNPEASYSRNNVVNTYGQDLSTTPVPRTITVGANINF